MANIQQNILIVRLQFVIPFALQDMVCNAHVPIHVLLQYFSSFNTKTTIKE